MIKWSETITVKRTAPGEYVRGEYRPGPVTYLDIKANVQNMNSGRIQGELQGRRINEALKIYTKEPVTNGRTVTDADKLMWNGVVYEIHETRFYNQGLRNKHYKTIAYRMNAEDQGEERGTF